MAEKRLFTSTRIF